MNKKIQIVIILLITGVVLGMSSQLVYASPFGAGVFGANVPFGGQTSLAISTSGNVTTPVTSPSDSGTLSSSTGTVTVVSSDVVGYMLYARVLTSTNMSNGVNTIPASANGTLAPLATNTWGYNTNGTTNFLGMGLTDSLIHSLSGPSTAGDTTSVTYGAKVDNTKKPGNYQATILYTAVPQTN
jgi:hypothetical protein